MSSHVSSPPKSVTIIGAGLGGLTLALALKKFGINPKLFEIRTPEYDFGGAIMLSPNALRILDNVEAFDRIRNKGFSFETMTFKTDHDLNTTGVYYFGHEQLYGYKALRIYRSTLIAELRKMVEEQGISIEYGKKFTHIVSENETGVRFAFEDGTEETAEVLIGVDGIHSKVRSYILPDIRPAYSGFLGVTYAFPTSKLRIPQGHEDYPFPVSVVGKNGAFVMAPQNADGSEMFVGRQFRYASQTRSAWDALLKEKTELIAMHQNDQKEWSDLVQSAQEQLSGPYAHSLNIWPFHTVPKMEKWASDRGRVIIMGDAAHAIPPTAGQGANQAFEDSYTLAFLLKSLSPGCDLATGLTTWREYRQARIDRVLVLSNQMNNLRLTEEEKESLSKDKVWRDESSEMGEGQQLAWLYTNDVQKDMTKELSKGSSSNK